MRKAWLRATEAECTVCYTANVFKVFEIYSTFAEHPLADPTGPHQVWTCRDLHKTNFFMKDRRVRGGRAYLVDR